MTVTGSGPPEVPASSAVARGRPSLEPELPDGFCDRLLEDLDFVRRLRREGRVVIAPEPVRSSVRRWESRGLVATTFRNWRYLIYHLLGREGDGVRGAYQRHRENR